MTPVALTFMILSFVLLWGGLIASSALLVKRPEIADYPAGGEDSPEDAHDDRPAMRDT